MLCLRPVMSFGRVSRSYEFALTVTQPLARVSDRLPEGVRGWLGERGEQTKASAASHSSGKGGNAHPLHPPLHDGMLDAERAGQLGGDGHGEGEAVVSRCSATLTVGARLMRRLQRLRKLWDRIMSEQVEH